MLLRTPDFYKKFHCIADKCTDTCCVGWEIDIDEKTLAKYRTVKSEFGDRLRANICDGHFCLLPGDRCPFLDKCGLCEIYKNLGKDALCDICREHPRFVEVYGDVKEQGIGLCCEEGVRLLLGTPSTVKKTTPVLQFVESEIDEAVDEIPDEVREARDQIFAERDNMFRILEQREIPLNKRLQMLLEYAVETSGIDEQNTPRHTADIAKIRHAWIDILGEGESFGPAWCTAYKAVTENADQIKGNRRGDLFSDEDGAKIVAYTLFRYYAKSLFDGDSIGKVQFAIFFWIILKEYGTVLAGEELAGNKTKVDPRIAAIKLLSKQVEYSEEVMEILHDNFAQNEAFSVQSFCRMLD